MGKVCNYLGGGERGASHKVRFVEVKLPVGSRRKASTSTSRSGLVSNGLTRALPSLQPQSSKHRDQGGAGTTCPSAPGARSGEGGGQGRPLWFPGVRVVHLCACLLVCLLWEGETVARGASLGLASPV